MGAGEIAFVAGATGFTGREVVADLRRRGIATLAHVRPDSNKLAHWQEHFAGLGAEVDTTAWDAEALRETFVKRRPTWVFCLIGTTIGRVKASRKSGAGQETFESVDYGLTKLLVDALVAAEVPARFVELSTIGVSPKSPSRYLRMRWKTEAYVKESGLDHVIVRPAFIIGSGRDDPRPVEHMAAALTNGTGALLGALGLRKLGARLRSTPNVDLAKAIVEVGVSEAHKNQVVEGRDLRAVLHGMDR